MAAQETDAGGVTPFFFDGNRWFGTVDSAAKWRHLVSGYLGDVERLLDAKMAQPAGGTSGAVPSFEFRREHVDGAVTLGEWASALGIDLRALAVEKS